MVVDLRAHYHDTILPPPASPDRLRPSVVLMRDCQCAAILRLAGSDFSGLTRGFLDPAAGKAASTLAACPAAGSNSAPASILAACSPSSQSLTFNTPYIPNIPIC